MTGEELLRHLRVDILRDSSLPYLWSDDFIFLTLSEAESWFARGTYALQDNTQSIQTEIGVAEYQLPAGVIMVLSAAESTNSKDLHDHTRRFIPTNLLTSTGTPSIFTLDESTNTIRLYPTPDAVYQINLRVARLPRQSITYTTTPEIPSQYHLDLVEYVAWKLLGSNDVDGQSVGASDRHMAEWKLRLRSAKGEYYRIRTGANPNVARSWTFQRNA